MSWNRVSAIVALVLALATPCRAAADPDAQDPAALAHTLGEEGLRFFQAGKWQEAYTMFQSAAAAVRAPTLLLYMAHCQARIGNLLVARRFYREVAQAPIADDAPLQFHTAQKVAREELRWIERRVAFVKLSIVGTPKGRLRVFVDGVEVDNTELDEVAVEPSSHVVEVVVEGAAKIRRSFVAVSGRTTVVELPISLPPEGAGPVQAAAPFVVKPSAPLPAVKPSALPPRPSSSLLLPAGVILGLGGASLAAGAVTGALALRSAADVKSRCDSFGHCLASDQANAAFAGRLGDASTGALVAGGVAVATGLVLAVVHARRKTTPATTGAVHVDIGPGYGAIRGGF